MNELEIRQLLNVTSDPYISKLTVPEIMLLAHETAKLKGWWENMDRNVPEQLALMHSEISEALEAYRDPMLDFAVEDIQYWSDDGSVYYKQNKEGSFKPEGFGIELADLVIRVCDTCQRYGIDLDRCLREKMLYNLSRPHRHGGKSC